MNYPVIDVEHVCENFVSIITRKKLINVLLVNFIDRFQLFISKCLFFITFIFILMHIPLAIICIGFKEVIVRTTWTPSVTNSTVDSNWVRHAWFHLFLNVSLLFLTTNFIEALIHVFSQILIPFVPRLIIVITLVLIFIKPSLIFILWPLLFILLLIVLAKLVCDFKWIFWLLDLSFGLKVVHSEWFFGKTTQQIRALRELVRRWGHESRDIFWRVLSYC